MLSISNSSFTLLPKVHLINLVITRLLLLLCMTSTWTSVYCWPNARPSCLWLSHVVYCIERNSTTGSVLLQVMSQSKPKEGWLKGGSHESPLCRQCINRITLNFGK